MWSGSDGCNTSWGKFSSRRTPLAANNGSMCFWSVTSAASLSSCVDGDSLKASSRFPGCWGVRVVYRSGRLLSTETSLLAPTRDPTTSGSCRDSLPEGYSVCQRCFTWPQNTSHSSALLSQETLFSSSSSVSLCTLSDFSRSLTARRCHIQSSRSKLHKLTRAWWQLFNVRTLRPGLG